MSTSAPASRPHRRSSGRSTRSVPLLGAELATVHRALRGVLSAADRKRHERRSPRVPGLDLRELDLTGLPAAVQNELVRVSSNASRAGQSLGPMEIGRLVRAIRRRLDQRTPFGFWRRLVGA